LPTDEVTVEIWKKIVDVQQHFNDLELRIRNFALALTGAFLALGGYAIKESAFVAIFGLDVSVSALIVLAAIVPLLAFYFMDKYWYHRLLDGAVRAGADAEAELQARGYKVGLGAKISEASPFDNRLYGKKIDPRDFFLFAKRKMHSRHKMDIFYGMMLISLVVITLLLIIGLRPQPQPPGPQATQTEPVRSGDAAGSHSSSAAARPGK